MARDSEDTKRRIFDAATAEFAAQGIAGARIDRIAAEAGANKQLIYAYFGSKRKLFEAVVSEHVTRFLTEVQFDPHDLPEYTGRMFDFFVEHPEVVKLGSWHSLEPGEARHRIPVIERAIGDRTRLLAAAQSQGVVTSAIPPAELLALVSSIAGAFAVASPERDPAAGANATTLRRRRAAVIEATRRISAN